MNFIVTDKSHVQNYFSYEKIYPDRMRGIDRLQRC